MLAFWLLGSPGAAAAPEGRLCEAEPTEQRLEYGDLVSCRIDRIGDADVFRFDGGSGESVHVRISRLAGGVPCFELLDPSSRTLGSLCANNFALFPLTQTGPYTIQIDEAGDDAVAGYSILVERVAPVSPGAQPIEFNELIDGEDAEIARQGDADSFFFFGEAEDTLRIGIARRGGGVSCIQVFSPEGTLLMPENVAGDGRVCTNLSGNYRIEQTGLHTVLVTDDNSGTVGAYALGLTCILGTCADIDLRPLRVAGCLSATGAPLGDQVVRLTQPDEPTQRRRTDVRGCFGFNVVRGKPYDVRLDGSDEPD